MQVLSLQSPLTYTMETDHGTSLLIDYAHNVNRDTPIEETMRALVELQT